MTNQQVQERLELLRKRFLEGYATVDEVLREFKRRLNRAFRSLLSGENSRGHQMVQNLCEPAPVRKIQRRS